MANANSKRMVSVKVALGRPTPQKPDSTITAANASIPQAAPANSGFGCLEMEQCEAFFALDSETSAYDLRLEPMTNQNSTFEVSLSQPKLQPQVGDAQPTEQTVEVRIKITTKLSAIDALGTADTSMLATGGRPTPQKPD